MIKSYQNTKNMFLFCLPACPEKAPDIIVFIQLICCVQPVFSYFCPRVLCCNFASAAEEKNLLHSSIYPLQQINDGNLQNQACG